MVRIRLVCRRLLYCLPKWLYHFSFSLAMNESSCFSTSSLVFGVVSVLDFFFYSNTCVVGIIAFKSVRKKHLDCFYNYSYINHPSLSSSVDSSSCPKLFAFSLKNFLQPWLVQLSGLSAGLQTRRSPVQFPVRAHAWVSGQVPSGGQARGKQKQRCCFSPFLSLSLSKNK